MERKALIVANPGEAGAENYCEGVNKDLDLYKEFLLSPAGGTWEPSEIVTLKRPSVKVLRAAIETLKQVDYSFAVFCGHGYARPGSGTILELQANVEVRADELRLGAPKHTLILDCCRLIAHPLLFFVEAQRMTKKAAPTVYPSLCRKYFDEYLDTCPNGLVVLQGCNVGETAGDDAATGGFYSASLVSYVKNWVHAFDRAPPQYEVLSVVKAHDAILDEVERISGGRQHPEIIKPRSGPYFPLGIIA